MPEADEVLQSDVELPSNEGKPPSHLMRAIQVEGGGAWEGCGLRC